VKSKEIKKVAKVTSVSRKIRVEIQAWMMPGFAFCSPNYLLRDVQ
jgi:hypothetical protein